MPLVHVSLRRGHRAPERAAIADAIYEAMHETFAVPEGDRFVLVRQRDDGDLVFDAHYLGMDRSAELVIIQIFCSDTRSTEQKKALYRAIHDRLIPLGVRGDDILITLTEVKTENWSFGRGEASYA